MSLSDLPFWLLASHIYDIGLTKWHVLCEHYPSMKDFFNLSQVELQEIGLSSKVIKAIKHPPWHEVNEDLKWVDESNHHIITFKDPRYPPPLKEIHEPPLLLYVAGNINTLVASQLGMVGSRHPSPSGLKTAEAFAFQLAKAGLVITSGLARGIDGASHQGALAAKGVTIAVAGTGLNHVYPKEHVGLALKIIEQSGAIISEFPLNSRPIPRNFPKRNRIISGLSLGILVVEAALKSGSLITAYHAANQGREVFAVPGSIHQAQTKGCHHLIRQGAKLVEKVEDILMELPNLKPKELCKEESAPALTSTMASVLQVIEYEITPIDMIILASGLTSGQVSSILLSLELDGFIRAVPGGYIREIKIV